MKIQLLILTLCSLPLLNAGITSLSISKDSRFYFPISKFGYDTYGAFKLNLTGVVIDGKTDKKIGFLLIRSDTTSQKFVDEEPTALNLEICLFDKIQKLSDEDKIEVQFNITNVKDQKTFSHYDKIKKRGFYTLYFANCNKAKVDFELALSQYNIYADGDNYLSVGDSPLPSIYFFTFVMYVIACFVWIYDLRSTLGKKVRAIHYIMFGLLVVKTLTVLSESVRYHFLKLYGNAVFWSVLYYIFAFLKGVMLFVVILLVGTGYSFIKPFLSDRDKKIFMLIIPLQIVANIALVVIEETSIGSKSWGNWYALFNMVDIICLGAILFPIIWSIRHLREKSDGKALRNLAKLAQFRSFYIIVVSYIYTTRLVALLLKEILPFDVIYINVFFVEIVTFLFFVSTGYKFRPLQDNPYLKVDEDDESTPTNSNIELETRTSSQSL